MYSYIKGSNLYAIKTKPIARDSLKDAEYQFAKCNEVIITHEIMPDTKLKLKRMLGEQKESARRLSKS
jgi:hypothetical protein